MSYENLILGVLFSIGIFAAKSGVGISYLIAGQAKMQAKISAFFLFALTYGLVFTAVALLLIRVDLMRHVAAIQTWIQSGMVVHMSLSGLLMVWGLVLLKRNGRANPKSKGWLLLALPCPVCVTVILFSAAFLYTCFPDTPKSAMLALYLAFILINLVTMGIVRLYCKVRAISAESLLGGAMLLIALYFFVSVTVMPQFADIDKIYRLAMYQSKASTQKVLHLQLFSVLIVAAFMGGYGFKYFKIRRIM
jgi:predicted transporter